MIVAVHQPQYLPWLGYFDKIDRADAFCYLDSVQYKKNEWQNRNRIKTSSGWQWLTVPVRYKFGQTIESIEIDNRTAWRKKHLGALVTNYSKAPYFKDFFDFFEELYSRRWLLLAELNIYCIEGLKKLLGMEAKPAIRSSELDLPSDPNLRLVEICRYFGADTYLAGPGGRSYMDLSIFSENNIRVLFQDFHHPVYPQCFGEFIPCLSVVDMLMNCGPDSLEIMRQSGGRAVHGASNS